MEEPEKHDESVKKGKRRTFTRQFKARLVALAESGEISVSQLAIDHQLNANQLRKWIVQGRTRSPALLPVQLSSSDPQPRPATVRDTVVMELSLAGSVLQFHHGWDPVAVATLIKALR